MEDTTQRVKSQPTWKYNGNSYIIHKELFTSKARKISTFKELLWGIEYNSYWVVSKNKINMIFVTGEMF